MSNGQPSTADSRIAIIDYGMGNRRSVEKAFHQIGANAVLTQNEQEISQADGIVICGVGAFPAGMESLKESGFDSLIKTLAGQGKPTLGICLGMQLLFDSSTEHEGSEGLGLIPGTVDLLRPSGSEKLPHIGWNVVTWSQAGSLGPEHESACAYYHVHSYCAQPDDRSVVLATGDYGGQFVSAVQSQNIMGVQFHPEKSSTDGLALLSRFVKSIPARS